MSATNPPATLDARASTVIAAIPELPAADLTIHWGDDMLVGAVSELGGDVDQALATYLRSGLEVSAAWARLLALLPEGGRVLDFASGYGRVTRFLLGTVPAERLVIADVDPNAVAFQVRQFGVRGVVATADPAGFDPGGPFDLIVVTSLFTHLPADLTQAWLSRLAGLLAPDGVLAFTVHDPRLLDHAVEVEDGFFFEPVSESRVLERHLYGSTWISQDRLRTMIDRALPEAAGPRAPVSFQQRIFGERQDLVLVDRHADRILKLDHPPFGFLEYAHRFRPSSLVVRGWGLDFGSGEALQRLEVAVDGSVVEAATERFAHPAVAERYGLASDAPFGFQLEIPLPALALSSTPITLRATTSQGVTGLLEARTLDGYLLRSARLELQQRADDLRFWRGRFAEVETAHITRGIEFERLQAELAATHASFFWSLRRVWFRLKRALGLPAVE